MPPKTTAEETATAAPTTQAVAPPSVAAPNVPDAVPHELQEPPVPFPPKKPKKFDKWWTIRFLISYIIFAFGALYLMKLFALMESYSATTQNLFIPGTSINAKYQLTQNTLAKCRKNYNEISCGTEDIIRYRTECFALTQCLNYAGNEWNVWGYIWDETWRVYEEEYSKSAWNYFYFMLAFYTPPKIEVLFPVLKEKRLSWYRFGTKKAQRDIVPSVPATETGTGTNAAPVSASNIIVAGTTTTNGAPIVITPEAVQLSPNSFRRFQAETLAEYERIRAEERAAERLNNSSAASAPISNVQESAGQQAISDSEDTNQPRSPTPPPLDALFPPLPESPPASSSDSTFVPASPDYPPDTPTWSSIARGGDAAVVGTSESASSTQPPAPSETRDRTAAQALIPKTPESSISKKEDPKTPETETKPKNSNPKTPNQPIPQPHTSGAPVKSITQNPIAPPSGTPTRPSTTMTPESSVTSNFSPSSSRTTTEKKDNNPKPTSPKPPSPKNGRVAAMIAGWVGDKEREVVNGSASADGKKSTH